MQKRSLFLSLTALYSRLHMGLLNVDDLRSGLFALLSRSHDQALMTFNRNQSPAMTVIHDETEAKSVHDLVREELSMAESEDRAVRMSGPSTELNDLLAKHSFPPVMHAVNAAINPADSYMRREEMIQQVVVGLRIPLVVLTHERHHPNITDSYMFTALPR